mgnify:FL=1
MKKLIYLSLCLLVSITTFAQTQKNEYAKSRKMLQLLMDGKGKELYMMLDTNAQKAVSAEQLNTLWSELT